MDAEDRKTKQRTLALCKTDRTGEESRDPDEPGRPGDLCHAASEADEVTRQLRSEFALLDKILELRKISEDRLSTKKSRKAARAAVKAANRARKNAEKSRPPLTTPKLKQPKGNQPPLASKWVEKVCWRCKSKFKIHLDWVCPPALCKQCTKYVDETFLPSGPDHSTPFTSIYIVRGGAPGSGKRR